MTAIDPLTTHLRLGGTVHEIDPAIPRELITLRAGDGAISWGVLYLPNGRMGRTVVHLMHPSGDKSRHYAVEPLVRAGFAVFAANSRYVSVNHDIVHERIVLDLAAGAQMLRERGFEGRVLFGSGGGAALQALYQAQATTPPAGRMHDIPGDPELHLGDYDLPPGDAFVSVAGHRGQGCYLMNVIDPAVVDEAEPLLSDPALDMYHSDNGYRPLPKASRYAPEFVARYRTAQQARVARLDALARAALARQQEAREQLTIAPAVGMPAMRAAAAFDRLLVVYRTLADPAFLDPSIDPSDRPPGTIFASDPLVGNYSAHGLGRYTTARGWLSTWSGLSSRAALTENLTHVDIPTLIVQAGGDTEIRPADGNTIFAAAAAAGKTFHQLSHTGHYLNPLPARTGRPPLEELMDVLIPWLQART